MSAATSDVLAALSALAELPAGVERVRLAAWLQAQDELAAAKARELELRQSLLDGGFPGLTAGTTNLALGAGYGLKAVLRQNFRLDEPKTQAALAKLRARGAVGVLLANRLVKFKPELAIGEYFKLEKADQRLFKDALTVTPGQASLELTRPRG